MTNVSAEYFLALGVTPVLGRDFSPSEDEGPGAHPVAVMSHDMWRKRLGGRPEVLGTVLTLNQESYTVVGVVPEVASSRATESRSNVLFSLRQNHRSRVMVLVRAAGDPAATSQAVQRALLGAEPGLVVLGLVAVGTATLLRSELLGPGPMDPVAFLGSAALLFLLVLLAGLVPARRAAAIHPMQALRKE
jgi:hypothetical protein